MLWDSVDAILAKLRENGMDGLATALNAFGGEN